ncbi:MAG: ABC transporter permease, partial [Lachnospiraceae bacterium]|nr:ABC transporter permease [Lachnospiraceae bacterium]
MKKLGKVWSEYSFIFVLIAIFIVYAITSSGLTWSGVMNIFRHSAVIGTVALGMGLICLTGEIDLSVGSMLALTAGFSVVVFNITGSILLTLLFALGFGAVCGFVNGLLVGGVQMPAFIVTLATMLIYRSFAQYFCQHLDRALIGGGSSVYKMDTAKAAYKALFGFGNGKIATIPTVGIVMLLMTALFVYLSGWTKYGKKIYAIGSNFKAAKMSGINVSMMKISAFTICGILTGLGAFLWIAMNGSADPATTGSSYEMY